LACTCFAKQIDVLNKRKGDLEKRMQLLLAEREQLQQALEDAAQRVLQLEQRCAHHAAEAQRAIRELELQRRLCSTEHRSGLAVNTSNNLHNTSGSSCSSGCHSANSSCCGSTGQPTSLFNELLETDDLMAASSDKHTATMNHSTDSSSDGNRFSFMTNYD
jgi:DNA repair exonuclease SbcCD ATPase subunit